MTTCARGCCWVPMAGICAHAYFCACHWDDRRPAAIKGGADRTYRDPTAAEAIGNVMKERGK